MLVRMLTLAMIMSLTGCGRIATTGPMPTEPLGMKEAPAPAPEGLVGVETKVRPHLGPHRDAPLAMVTVGPVLENGELANAMSAAWEFGFWVPGAGEHRYRTVRLDVLGRGQLRAAFGETAAPPPALVLSELPAPGAAIATARSLGLPEGQSYEVEYLATPKGPLVRVSNRQGGEARKRVSFDPRTGGTIQEVEAQLAFRRFAKRR